MFVIAEKYLMNSIDNKIDVDAGTFWYNKTWINNKNS